MRFISARSVPKVNSWTMYRKFNPGLTFHLVNKIRKRGDERKRVRERREKEEIFEDICKGTFIIMSPEI